MFAIGMCSPGVTRHAWGRRLGACATERGAVACVSILTSSDPSGMDCVHLLPADSK
jgi:hypothetical protein